jgi:hypothetical protein
MQDACRGVNFKDPLHPIDEARPVRLASNIQSSHSLASDSPTPVLYQLPHIKWFIG